jgi:SAM-dependent methyltransferase
MRKDKQMLQFWKNDFSRLSSKQRAVRDALQSKIGSEYSLVGTSCVCGSADTMLISRRDRYELLFNVVMCSTCGLIRLKPCLSPESLKEFYRKDYWNLYMGEGEAASEEYFNNMIVRGSYIKDIFDSFVKCDWKKMRVLEVGCQAGGILLPFLKAGAQTRGYDYDRRFLDYGRRRNFGLDLRLGGVDDVIAQEEEFDVIILNHVLEHLVNPLDVIAGLRQRLTVRGFLYIAVPGVMNPGFYLSPTKSLVGGFHISHLFYFTVATLEQCLAGFNIMYKDRKIRMICQRSKEALSRVRTPDESKRILSFIRWYEQSLGGRAYRRLFAVWERYYNPAVRRIYALQFIPRKLFIPFTY